MSAYIVKRQVVWVDIACFLLCVVAVELSHLTTFPSHLFEPIRMIVIMSLFYFGYKRGFSIVNSCALAFLLPLFSSLISGHPIFLKCFLMSIELFLNILFLVFIGKYTKIFFAVFLSILLSKVVYYILKYYLIVNGIMDSNFISIGAFYQLIVMFCYSILISYIFKDKKVSL